ncbi:hypothetical protein BRC83_02595 [Halobacteriales archaeon QS_1_68_17]|nr:MAG: hypothetical protein BRC83_02595 [Halobacteriales archaeon QS_1_68_17]
MASPSDVAFASFGYALVSLPLVVPGAFCAGVLVWRVLPESIDYSGVLRGLGATVLGYLLAASATVVLLLGYDVLVDPSTLAPSAGDTALTLLPLVPFVFLYLSWAILPVGAAVGGLYERGRRQLDGSGR